MIRRKPRAHPLEQLNRDHFLRVHGVTAEAWAKRWGIDVSAFPWPCCVCGVDQSPTVPFACGELRGLVAPDCACGHPTPPFCVVWALGSLFGGLV